MDTSLSQRPCAGSGARGFVPAAIATAVAVLGAVVFFRTDGVAQQLVYHCVSGASAVAVVLGARLHRPSAARPWHTLAAGLAGLTAGDVAADLVRAGGPVPGVVPPVIYAGAWLLLAHAVRSLARARTPEGDEDAVVDAAATVLAVGLVLWRVLLEPVLRHEDAAASTAIAVAVFPLAQIALLALYLRLLFGGGARSASAWVLAVGGGLAGLVGSLAHVALMADGGDADGGWHNAFWMCAYAAPGVAALLPDMRQLTVPAACRTDLSMSRWTVLAAALLATTATTTLTAPRMTPLEALVAALPVPALVLWRLRRVLLSRQAAVARAEEGSRRHALLARLGELAAAGDVETLRTEACAALSWEMGANAVLRPDAASTPSQALCAAVPAAPTPWRVLVVDRPGPRWSAPERTLVDTVANVLSAAEARDASQRHVRWAADHDELTGLANRRHVMRVLSHRLQVGEPAGTALLLLDLDGFKQVNDEHGHACGDAVLVAVAERLIGSCRDADLVARLAGDEFVVLCQGPLTRADAERLAHRIRARTADPVVTPAGPVTVGASVGVALARFGDTADELLLRADIRMYDDKRARAEAGQATRCGARLPADMASGRS